MFSALFLVMTTLGLATGALANEQVQIKSKGDHIAFDRQLIRVPLGKKVEIEFHNSAATDSEIYHNIAVLKPGSMDKVLKVYQESEYNLDRVLALPEVIGITRELAPQQSAKITVSPKAPGTYPYVCLVPGHADMMGMRGNLELFTQKSAKLVVSQKDKKFQPTTIDLAIGDTLTFVNDDAVVHNLFSISPTQKFNLGMQKPGDKHEVTFSKAGKAFVRCAIHPKMKLEVNIKDQSAKRH